MHTIMIVDDSVSVVKYLEDIINRRIGGFKVRTSFSAEDGLASAQEMPPDLLLLDISLPRMNGIDACKKFRELFPNLPIIIITAELDPINQTRAFQAGASDFIIKPFNAEQILSHISIHLKNVKPIETQQQLS